MIDPKLKAEDRIYKNLPENLQKLMRENLLTEEEHEKVLQDIKDASYFKKSKIEPPEKPKYVIVLGQTGAGKSHLTEYITKQNPNIVIIDSDKYKGYREDSDDIQREHLVEYAYLTAPDAYWHRDQMIYDAMENRYNILMECATTEKDGMFIDTEKIMQMGYDVEIVALGVSDINSLISIHERYEDQIKNGYVAAKLTSIARHDDSYTSLIKCIRNLDEKRVKVSIYERGKGFPFTPKEIYHTGSEERRFESAIDAMQYAQAQDRTATIAEFPTRYSVVSQRMISRGAPIEQINQLNEVLARYQKIIQKERM